MRTASSTALLLLAALLLAPATAAQALLHMLPPPQPQGSGHFGDAVAGVPDADGDGRGDLLVGASLEHGGVGSSGQAHLFSGATGALLHTFASPNPERSFGASVAGVPDVDGDGSGDLLVGAPLETVGFPNAGRAYVFSGATRALIHTLTSPDPQFDGSFGRAVGGVPDVDGDGRSDLLVGARDSGGRAYVFSGATGALLDSLASPNPMPGGNFGGAVAGVPDADGDGHGDLLVGAFAEIDGGTQAGRAYLFSGATRALLHTLTTPNPEAFGDFGGAVAGVPDVDGDGRGDLLVGAPREDAGGGLVWAGRAYLFSGATGALIHPLTSPDPEGSGRFGISVSGVTDIDGDGRGDLLVGAFFEDETGRAYALSGATGALIHTLVSPNPEPVGTFGGAVAGVPDANGDGSGDLLVGADLEDGGVFNAGRAYLFSGTATPAAGLTAAASKTSVEPGGSVTFSYTITNDTDSTVSGDLFFTAERGGNPLARAVIRSGTVPAGQVVSGSYTQAVPQNAPPGAYAYTLRIGRFPNVTLDAEAFTITVTGAARAAGEALTWRVADAPAWASVADGAAGEAATVEETALSAHPNPFRDRAVLRYTLAVTADVRLAVFDVLGREVAVLVSGPVETGRHEATFDAATLPGGVYLVRLEAGGQAVTQQITLVR